MSSLQERCAQWKRSGHRVVIATIDRAEGSTPFARGTKMAFNDAGDVSGGISSGCVDGAVASMAARVFADGCTREEWFDSSDSLADVSLMCGGSILVRVSEMHDTEIDTDTSERTPVRLFLAGANAYAQALTELARACDMDVTVTDPRPAFARAADFAGAHVICAWPDRAIHTYAIDTSTAIVMLGHDERYDTDLLAYALASDAFYVGAVGNRATQSTRRTRLRRANVGRDALARLHGPAGLDLGGRTPHETALAILAEIVATSYRASSVPLNRRSGPIHAHDNRIVRARMPA